MHQHHHNQALVILSVIIAIVSSYIALDLANSFAYARKRHRWGWLLGGSFALGIGIWSMHFVGMLAFSLPGIEISYDVPLMALSIVVAIGASALALYIVSLETSSLLTKAGGGLAMGVAIAGMHYIGIASMRMSAIVHWDKLWVLISIVIAVVSSFIALFLAFKLKNDFTRKGFLLRGGGGVFMGFGISGMHYSGMHAMHFIPVEEATVNSYQLLASDGLLVAVLLATTLVLGIAIWASAIDRAMNRRIAMNEILEGAIISRDNFLSVASHELRTPLTSIKLQTQLLMRYIEKLGMKQDVSLYLQKMLGQTDHSVERLSRLVDDMLDISRIQTNKLTLNLEEFDLSLMVQDIVEGLTPHLMEKNCPVTFKTSGAIHGRWDKFRLEQVVTNLLTNAGRYGSGKPVEVWVNRNGDEAQIHVKDYGAGIAKDDQERIFQRFERANADISGLGLGLYIAQEILKMHNGKIFVESELNKGSEFIVSLPLSL
ncbi:MHYT domain-containing protein [Peredibacter sp. HCB2-198]|uniref:sensor histidine kinase n=1 Tax=Peredibacter sp. HCB2-198 TaxID=3383025 RepID=UPI0038B69984